MYPYKKSAFLRMQQTHNAREEKEKEYVDLKDKRKYHQARKRVILSSALRNNPTTTLSNAFLYELHDPLTGKYSIESVTFFNSLYNVRAVNNTIYFYENATAKSATITPGIYDDASLATAVKSAMDTASGGHNTFTVTYSDVTGKYTFTAANNFHFTFGTNTSNSIARVLGFLSTNGVAATTQVGDFMAQLHGVDLIAFNIKSDEQQFNFFSSNQGTPSTTFVIPNNVDNFAALTYMADQAAPIILDFGSRSPNHLHVSVSDFLTGDALDLNGADFHITLRKEDDF